MAEDVTVFIFTCSYAGVYFPTVLAVIEESEHEPAAPACMPPWSKNRVLRMCLGVFVVYSQQPASLKGT